MDWPVATVLLGTLGTLAVAILKWIPRRDGDRSMAAITNGRVYARAVDLAKFVRGWCRWNRPITYCVPKFAPTSRNYTRPCGKLSIREVSRP